MGHDCEYYIVRLAFELLQTIFLNKSSLDKGGKKKKVVD
jgi:hypothetical protein